MPLDAPLVIVSVQLQRHALRTTNGAHPAAGQSSLRRCVAPEVITKMAAVGTVRCLLQSFSRVKDVTKTKKTVLRCSVRTFCGETSEKGSFHYLLKLLWLSNVF